MTMITPSYLGETIEYSSLHACRSTLEDPNRGRGVGSQCWALRQVALRQRSSDLSVVASYICIGHWEHLIPGNTPGESLPDLPRRNWPKVCWAMGRKHRLNLPDLLKLDYCGL